MRLAVEPAFLESNVEGDTQVFQINATGAAFRTLIDGLYSNKEQSIVRELTANAWDSHRRAGTSRAFTVQSPTIDDPTFGVRDYGIGMTHTKVMSLYTTLFMSDKSDTNDQVGMFGLGSKSPFSYTDQFNLTCYDGKFARHYSCAIGAGSVPQINVVAQNECDEPRGVHVSFSVKPSDFQKFRDAIAQVRLGHEPCFETNQANLPSRGSIAIEGKGWRSYTNSHIPSQWAVRQGCVIYPLTETGGLRLPKDQSDRHYLIECPIGTIQVTASRENVSYKEQVIEYLRERIEHIRNEAARFAKEQTNHIENVLEYFTRIKEITPNFVTTEFTHPFTGLTGVGYKLPAKAVEINAKNTHYNGVWGYDYEDELCARAPTCGALSVVLIQNWEHIIDPDADREGVGRFFFTSIERRKINMRLRGYATEVLKKQGVAGWLGFELDEKMLKHFYPNVTIIRVNYNDMPTGLKNRARVKADDREETPIRGISRVPLSGGRVKTTLLSDIKNDGTTAWVLADFHRRESEYVRALAEKFGITTLFTSTIKSVPRMVERGIPSFEQFVSRSVSWSDLFLVNEEYGGYDNLPNNLLKLTRVLAKHRPDLYARLSRSKSCIGLFMRRIAPIVPIEAIPFGNHNHQRTFKMFNEDEKKEQRALTPTPELKQVTKWMRNLDRKNSPLSLILKGVGERNKTTPEHAEEIAQALLAVSKLIPPEKYQT